MVVTLVQGGSMNTECEKLKYPIFYRKYKV